MFSLREKPSNLILLLAYVFILNGCAVTEVAVNLAKGDKVQSNEEIITEDKKTSGLEDKLDSNILKSPSIVSRNNSIYLVDMEYAGLDSPIKLHIDYLIHPRNVVYTYKSYNWTNFFYSNLISKYDMENINIYNSFYSLQWSLIVLNEFLPSYWNYRIHSDPSRIFKHDTIKKNQLKKSELYLKASLMLYEKKIPQKLFSESERIFLSKSY